MEQWHAALFHKAFSDLKNGTEHGTMAQSMAQTQFAGFRRLPLFVLFDCVCFVYSLLVSPSIIAV